MERTIFPLIGQFNDRGLLLDIWPSGMMRVITPEDPEYIEALSMTENPPEMMSDQEIWNLFSESKGNMDTMWVNLNEFERERLGAMLENLRDERTGDEGTGV
jgi:hypothetical protein